MKCPWSQVSFLSSYIGELFQLSLEYIRFYLTHMPNKLGLLVFMTPVTKEVQKETDIHRKND